MAPKVPKQPSIPIDPSLFDTGLSMHQQPQDFGQKKGYSLDVLCQVAAEELKALSSEKLPSPGESKQGFEQKKGYSLDVLCQVAAEELKALNSEKVPSRGEPKQGITSVPQDPTNSAMFGTHPHESSQSSDHPRLAIQGSSTSTSEDHPDHTASLYGYPPPQPSFTRARMSPYSYSHTPHSQSSYTNQPKHSYGEPQNPYGVPQYSYGEPPYSYGESQDPYGGQPHHNSLGSLPYVGQPQSSLAGNTPPGEVSSGSTGIIHANYTPVPPPSDIQEEEVEKVYTHEVILKKNTTQPYVPKVYTAQERQAILADTVACRNEERSYVQGEGYCDETLLHSPGRACMKKDQCKEKHVPWTTNGVLLIAPCMALCEVCGKIPKGDTSNLVMHVQKKHCGPRFDPVEHRMIFLTARGRRLRAQPVKDAAYFAKRKAAKGNSTPDSRGAYQAKYGWKHEAEKRLLAQEDEEMRAKRAKVAGHNGSGTQGESSGHDGSTGTA